MVEGTGLPLSCKINDLEWLSCLFRDIELKRLFASIGYPFGNGASVKMATALLAPLQFDLEAFLLTPASTSMDWKASTFMYVIQSQEFCKVGITNNVPRRMLHFRAGNPHPLPVIATFRFGSRIAALLAERTTHSVLAPYAIGREWFEVSPELAENAARVVTEATRLVRKAHRLETAARAKLWFEREEKRMARLANAA